MEKQVIIRSDAGPAAREQFYRLVGCIPASDAAWAERQARLSIWRLDPGFEPYWSAIDQMLADDFASCRQRAAAMAQACDSAGALQGYDFDAWRAQREYDLKHAVDHLP